MLVHEPTLACTEIGKLTGKGHRFTLKSLAISNQQLMGNKIETQKNTKTTPTGYGNLLQNNLLQGMCLLL